MAKTEKEKILEVFKKSNRPITPTEAATLANANKNTARWCCLKLLKEDKLERLKRGQYKLKKP